MKLKRPFIRLKLAEKISLLVIVLIILSVVVSITVSSRWYLNRMMENIRQNTLNVVQITAQSPIIIEGLENQDTSGAIQDFVQNTQEKLEQIDVIVVADKDGLRYGHTVSERVGEPFSAIDNDRAIMSGETYVTVGPGTLGDSLRAFTPVKNNSGDILGFVMAGTLLDSIAQAKRTLLLMQILFIIGGSVIGVGGAIYLSYYIKKSLLSYEPEDIARLYLENQGILETVYEGVIAIDQTNSITLINETARKYLQIDNDCIGQEIDRIFPLSKLPETVQTGEKQLDVSYALGGRIVLSNNIPIHSKDGEIIGGVCSFRDQTEVNRLAEQITGVNRIVDSLRATTHEFKNKLHVILGLAEMGKTDQLKQYIGAVSDQLQNSISFVMNHITEPTIAALCIGKGQRAAELKITWNMDDDTYFDNHAGTDVNGIVVILGNLIDNALENLDSCEKEEKQIQVLINDEGDDLLIRVTDTGTGIEDVERIFEKGYSTKPGSRGYGLHLMKKQIELLDGKIEVYSELGEGTAFEVRIPLTK